MLFFCDPDHFYALPERITALYFQPHTLAEATDALLKSGGQILAGGTDFYPALEDRPVTTSVIDISRVAELRGIRQRSRRRSSLGAAPPGAKSYGIPCPIVLTR